MGKLAMFALLLYVIPIVIPTAAVGGGALESKAVERWFEVFPRAKENVTKLHFYFHDTVSGKNPTALRIASCSVTDESSTAFGSVAMMDDPLTVSPEPNSTVLGRAQGIYGSGSFNEVALLMTLNFVFIEGEYNGSTLSVLGRNPIFHEYREMPVVGGSGIFRLARGFAMAKTYWLNLTSGDAIVEYNVTVAHSSLDEMWLDS